MAGIVWCGAFHKRYKITNYQAKRFDEAAETRGVVADKPPDQAEHQKPESRKAEIFMGSGGVVFAANISANNADHEAPVK